MEICPKAGSCSILALVAIRICGTSPDRKQYAASPRHPAQGLSFSPEPDLVKVIRRSRCYKVDILLHFCSGSLRGLIENIFRAIRVMTPCQLFINLEEVVIPLDGRVHFLLLEESTLVHSVYRGSQSSKQTSGLTVPLKISVFLETAVLCHWYGSREEYTQSCLQAARIQLCRSSLLETCIPHSHPLP